MAWRWLRELLTGWTDDTFCRVCGKRLQEWTVVTRADPETGEAQEWTRYKSCLGSSIRHGFWEQRIGKQHGS